MHVFVPRRRASNKAKNNSLDNFLLLYYVQEKFMNWKKIKRGVNS